MCSLIAQKTQKTRNSEQIYPLSFIHAAEGERLYCYYTRKTWRLRRFFRRSRGRLRSIIFLVAARIAVPPKRFKTSLFGYCSAAAGGDQLDVFGQDPSFYPERRWPPVLFSLLKLFIGNVQVKQLVVCIYGDLVSFIDQGDGAARRGFRRYMADNQAMSPAGEAAISNQSNRITQTCPDQSRRG